MHKLQAISYIRFSSQQQAKGSSQDRQEALIAQWLREHPAYELSNLSASDLGVSGYSGKHLKEGALASVLVAIEQKKLKAGAVLLVEAIDRLGRLEALNMVELITRIVRGGVSICTLENGKTYSEESINNQQSDLFILVGAIHQSHDYSKKLGTRVAAAYEHKRIKAKANASSSSSFAIGMVKRRNCFWLDSEGKLKPRESEIIRRCIDLYLSNRGTRGIVLDLSTEFPELKETHPSTIKRWLRNPSLIGTWENKSKHEPIPNVFEALISKEKFYEIQRMLRNRTKHMSPEQKYPLSGLITCKHCDSKFYFRRKIVSESDVIVYANCSNYLKRGLCKNNTTIPYEVLEYCFKETYTSDLLDLARKETNAKLIQEIENLESEVFSINTRINRLLLVIEASPDETNTISKISELNEKKKDILWKISLLKAKAINPTPPSPPKIDNQKELGFLDLNKIPKPTPEMAALIKAKKLQQAKELIATFSRASEIESNKIELREQLKMVGFSLLVDGKTITSTSTTMLNEEFNLIRRSQQFACYIVKHTSLDSNEAWLAINRTKGLLASAETEDLLIQNLLNGAGSIA